MLKEINKDISYDSENMSNEEDESKENMKSDFMDESNYFAKKDNYSEKGNLILNNNSNDTKGKLNNLNNPFIKAQKNLELTEDLKQNNIKKEKEKNNKYEGLNEEELKKIRDKLLVERNDTTNLYNKIPIKVNKIEQIKKRDELEKKLAQINNDLMQIRLRLKGNI